MIDSVHPDATRQDHAKVLAEAIDALPTEQHPVFAYNLVHSGLMKFSDPTLAGLIDVAKDRGVLADTLAGMFSMLPQAAAEMIAGSAEHCLVGTDHTGEGVGGWNQDEFEKAYSAVIVARDGLPLEFPA